MGVSTYSELKTEIGTHLDRDDLTSSVDTFIDLAEARHKRDIRIREMITRGTITVDGRYEDLPTGFLEGITFRLLTSPVTVLDFVSLDEMAVYRSETTGKPSKYTIGAQIEFDKAPDSAYSGEMMYYASVTALSDGNTTNAILTRAPDVYLYGALLATAPFLMNDERIMTWGQLYKDAVAALSQSARQERHMGRLVPKLHGSVP